MGKIDRSIIVPYIESVCSLHLARVKLYQRKKELESELFRLEDNTRVVKPSSPIKRSVISAGRIFALLWGLFELMGVFILITSPVKGGFWTFLTIIFAIFAAICIIGPIRLIMEDVQVNKEREEQYYSNLSAARQKEAAAKKALTQRLPGLKQELSVCESKIAESKGVLNRLYESDVIPLRYRNVHAAMYLYDWFRYGNGDDISTALNTFVLEQIKERLDRIIENQMTIIVNQQLSIAMQQQSMELQRQQSRTLIEKLDSLELSVQENTACAKMIEGRMASLEWYADQKYLSNLFR